MVAILAHRLGVKNHGKESTAFVITVSQSELQHSRNICPVN